ncbi:MAG: hypothetical protein AAGM16_13090 [Pseudomonadota bacterium]
MNADLRSQLDGLISRHKAQPVGSGHIDIIVPRNGYRNFAQDLIHLGVSITAVSWWEYVPSCAQPNSYGMGGPPSEFFEGWFVECGDVDDVPQAEDSSMHLRAVVELVESKDLGFRGGPSISFAGTTSLRPAFWLNVDGMEGYSF